jgi:bifunctional DNA-binding transcriptional regulator/antitoxin component of YhaV-PrlF toxin-antitoxin module
MKMVSEVFELKMGKEGLLELPTELQRSLGFHEGDKLVAYEKVGQLVLEKPETIELRLKARLAHIPKDRSIVDELIADRREAAKKEAEE